MYPKIPIPDLLPAARASEFCHLHVHIGMPAVVLDLVDVDVTVEKVLVFFNRGAFPMV